MNYWPAGPCNLAEMGEPLLKLCKEMGQQMEKKRQKTILVPREPAASMTWISGERRLLLMEGLSGISGLSDMHGFAEICMISIFLRKIRNIWKKSTRS